MLDIEIRIGLNQNEKIGVVTIFLRIEERKGNNRGKKDEIFNFDKMARNTNILNYIKLILK